MSFGRSKFQYLATGFLYYISRYMTDSSEKMYRDDHKKYVAMATEYIKLNLSECNHSTINTNII